MNKYLFLLSLLAASMSLHAQTVIEGTVIDSLGQAQDAYITVSPRGSNNIVGFADTDSKGHYRVEVQSEADSLLVIAAGLAIGQQHRVVANRSQTLDFSMKSKLVTIKEVTVKAQKILEHGDTISYNVAAYQQQGDRVIGDVLKKMPGIEVSGNGTIKFNGKAIKKFYVEDMDLLQGRYGIATNNINAKDVASVQVLQNHQPIKALQGKSLTDDVAINLKLKDSAKGTVAINTALTPAFSLKGKGKLFNQNLLWGGEMVGMYFAKKCQNMTLWKGNDTGDDVSGELASHYASINSVGLYPFCPMGAVMPSGAGLSSKRTFDNHSNIATANHLEKLDSVREMSINASYYNDFVRREGTSESDIFLSEDARLQTSETLFSTTTTNTLSANLRYCKNASGGFLANVLKLDGGWEWDKVGGQLGTSAPFGTTSRSTQRVSQHFDRPTLAISNTINTIRDFGSRTLDLHFSVGYARRPNTLTVGIDSIEQAVSHRYVQDLESQHIAANAHTNFSWRFGDFTLSYGLLVDASLHGVETDLQGFTPPQPSPAWEGALELPSASINTNNSSPSHAGEGRGGVSNDLWYNTYTLRLGQEYRWQHGRWRATLGCPLELYTQTLSNSKTPSLAGEGWGGVSYTNLLVIPSLTLTYYYRNWSGSTSGNYQRSVGDPGGIYDGYIMSNYRSFQRSYVDQLSETERVNASGSIGYRSALTATFININANYTRTSDNQIYGYNYQGATSVVQAVNQSTTADSYSLNVDASKGFDFMQSTIRAFGGLSRSQSERLVSAKVFAFHSDTYSIGGGGTITPLPWLNFVLSSGYSWSRSLMDGAKTTTVKSATQRLKVNVFVTRQLTLTATAEDNYNNMTATDRHVWFGDLQAKYKIGSADLELEANNIFNQRTYTRTTYSALDIYTTTSHLRPLNLLLTLRFKLL